MDIVPTDTIVDILTDDITVAEDIIADGVVVEDEIVADDGVVVEDITPIIVMDVDVHVNVIIDQFVALVEHMLINV